MFDTRDFFILIIFTNTVYEYADINLCLNFDIMCDSSDINLCLNFGIMCDSSYSKR